MQSNPQSNTQSGTPAPEGTPPRQQPNRLRFRHLLRRYWKTIVAVLAGNFIYFVLLYSWLPPHARHRRNQIDLGLLIDFWICLFLWGLLELSSRRKKRARNRE
jgi:hypothetical protein